MIGLPKYPTLEEVQEARAEGIRLTREAMSHPSKRGLLADAIIAAAFYRAMRDRWERQRRERLTMETH